MNQDMTKDMIQEQCVRIAARTLSLYLFAWAVSDMLAIPHMVLSIRHYLHELSIEGGDAGRSLATRHYLRLELTYLGESILRTVLLLTGAKWLYSAGPWLQSFFAGPAPVDESAGSATGA